MSDFFNLSGFAIHQYAWLLLAALLFLSSLWAFFTHRNRLAIILLTCSGASLFTFAALLDPFLNLWDERVHALVVKNSIEHPFKPLFYQYPVVPENNYIQWISAHVWLHKQPLFLWQMELSCRCFGVNEFALRLPGVIMATISIFIVYRMASLLVNEKLGYYSAISVLFSWFLIHLVSGSEGIDQNDVCFFFYITASLWAFTEYIYRKRNWKWALLIGIFCGCAVLTKWLTGLLVFFVWGVFLIAEYHFSLKKWKCLHMLLALGIALLLILPWQIYTFMFFPDAALYEYQYSSRHLFESIEGHDESFYYYLQSLPYLFIGYKNGSASKSIGITQIITYVILLIGIIQLYFLLPKKNHKITFFVTLAFVYLFFSVAKTKMPAFPFMIASLWFIILGSFIYLIDKLLLRLIHNRIGFVAVFSIFLCFFAFYMGNFSRIRSIHTSECSWRADLIANKAIFQKYSHSLPLKTLVFNVKGDGRNGMNMQFIEASYYIGRDCYALIPSKETVQNLKNQGFSIACFTHNPLPDYLRNDPEVILIPDIILNDL